MTAILSIRREPQSTVFSIGLGAYTSTKYALKLVGMKWYNFLSPKWVWLPVPSIPIHKHYLLIIFVSPKDAHSLIKKRKKNLLWWLWGKQICYCLCHLQLSLKNEESQDLLVVSIMIEAAAKHKWQRKCPQSTALSYVPVQTSQYYLVCQEKI